MAKHCLLVLMATLLWVPSRAAQTPGKQTKKPRVKSGVTNIRRIDLLNFTYHPSLCSEVFGIPGTVKVRRGKFQNSDSFYRVAANKIIYGDVTGDGREDAIVHVRCGGFAGNFSNSEIFIYTLQNGRAKLLAELDTEHMERDYTSYYSGGFLVGIADTGVKVECGRLIIEVFADGSNAGPEYVATLDYKLSGSSLTLSGKPQRRRT